MFRVFHPERWGLRGLKGSPCFLLPPPSFACYGHLPFQALCAEGEGSPDQGEEDYGTNFLIQFGKANAAAWISGL